MPFLILYITLKSIYNVLSPCFIPYHLFARILLFKHITYPPVRFVHKSLHFALYIKLVVATH